MCVSAFFYGHPSIAGDTLTRVGELVSLAAERGPGRSWVATRTHTPHESQEVCSHNKGERCKVVAVHAVKMTVPTQGSEVPSYIKRGLHTSCEPRGWGRARGSQRGRAAEKAGGRERARGHKRACTQNAHTRSGAHPDRGLTLRAGRVTRADGGGVRDLPPVKRRPRPVARCYGCMVVKSSDTSPATVPPSIRPCSLHRQ